MNHDLTQKLNKRQTEAVTHENGPLLIVAGAGTGKTTVLINRLAYLILEKGFSTEEILLLTFTEKSAGELEERADKLLPYGYVDLWIHTFHGFCERILREHALDIGLAADFKLISATEQWILIKRNLSRFNLDYYRPLGNPTKFISELLRHFSRLKDEDVSARDYLETAENNQDEDELEVKRVKELASAYATYNELLMENNFLDFGDLIIFTLKLFKTRSNILRVYQNQFKHIMVDEFQDTNWAQYELIKMLALPSNNLTVVGDDDQCLPGNSLISTKHGKKKIKDIKIGEEVATAVGKGYLSYSPVEFVNKTKKKCRLLEFTLSSGKKITVTDNHKMFCLDVKKKNDRSEIKIKLEMCANQHRLAKSKNGFLDHPQIYHTLNLETSDAKVIAALKKMNLSVTAAKIGKRIRITSIDLAYLGTIAKKIQKEVGGFIEVKMNIAKNNKQHLKSLVIPAKNIFPGMSLPVLTNKGLVYEEIINRTEKEKIETVYDLEIERTHNFIADGVAVHNSIYKFRGASLSNIMQFKDDYKEAKELILIDNYRSRQEILDYSYQFIKHNNPNRLEEKLHIDKKLKASANFSERETAPIRYLQFNRGEEEVSFVAAQIADLYNQNKVDWLDFAILVRANDTAEAYVKELIRLNIPNQFVSLKGLYFKPIILDCLAYLRLLDNYHESSALFRVLSMPDFKVSHLDIITINKFAKRKVWSLFEALKNIAAIPGVSSSGRENIFKLLTLLEKHSKLVSESEPSKIFLRFAYDSGLIKSYDFDRDQEIFSYLNQFYQKIKKFEETLPASRLSDFMQLMDLELEAGEVGALRLDFADNDTVKIMTVHAAKGLEFKYVFLVNIVDKKFPTISRSEKINIPEALVKEKITASKESHVEEERRLFYVAATRAKEELFITGAKDYGGAREKKPSPFIAEMGLDVFEVGENQEFASKLELLRDIERLDDKTELKSEKLVLPDKFSFSQLAAYSNCPLQYKFAFVLKIPVPTDKASLIFGRVLHNVLNEFLEPLLEAKQAFQNSLFGEIKKPDLNLEKLLEIYENRWQADGYNNKEERDKYYQKGKEILKNFWQRWLDEGTPEILFLEKNFTFKIGDGVIKGAIDRVDRLSDGTLEIIDYKTGNPKEKLEYTDKRQLILYKIFLEEFLGTKVSLLSYYYLEGGYKTSFVAKDKDVEKLRLEVLAEIAEIKKSNFPPNPSELCKYCDFRDICQWRLK